MKSSGSVQLHVFEALKMAAIVFQFLVVSAQMSFQTARSHGTIAGNFMT
jgi:hypothetical protein